MAATATDAAAAANIMAATATATDADAAANTAATIIAAAVIDHTALPTTP